jgi:hypothetical protein
VHVYAPVPIDLISFIIKINGFVPLRCCTKGSVCKRRCAARGARINVYERLACAPPAALRLALVNKFLSHSSSCSFIQNNSTACYHCGLGGGTLLHQAASTKPPKPNLPTVLPSPTLQ